MTETREVGQIKDFATLDVKSSIAPTVLGALVIGGTRLLAPELGMSPILFAFFVSAIFALGVLLSNQGPWTKVLFWPILTFLIFNSATGSESLRNTDIPAAVRQGAEEVSLLLVPSSAAAQEPTPRPWGNPW